MAVVPCNGTNDKMAPYTPMGGIVSVPVIINYERQVEYQSTTSNLVKPTTAIWPNPEQQTLWDIKQTLSKERQITRIRRYRRPTKQNCHCCRQLFSFCWRCRCGFQMCQLCMDENAWGLTCNGITWQCPDCGDQNGFGNQ